ncbi:hypothetical protein HID58_021478 [Brassica napus]|uniref:O-fucosyltransferase family protein n=1 Tax=Brassica napus TaxID=3708 RepID=A0ABQ8CYQ6_BRANA|nr:hypothetical protein HID58_021478 [Brassica napus]
MLRKGSSSFIDSATHFALEGADQSPRNYTSNGVLFVSCNGGLNQMRSAICDMVAVARLLNLTLVVPELDKTSFWADPSSGFEDIFDVRHFIDSLRDEVRIFRRLPKRFSTKYGYQMFQMFQMPPMDMLAFSGCTHGCGEEEAEELKKMRFAFVHISLVEREGDSLRGEEVALVLKAFGFDKNTQIAAGEIYGSEHRLSVLREAFPRIVSLSVLTNAFHYFDN